MYVLRNLTVIFNNLQVLIIRNASFFGGAEIYSLNLAKGLKRKNLNAVIWTNNARLVSQAKRAGVKSSKKRLGPMIRDKLSFLVFITCYFFLFLYYFIIILILKLKNRVTVLHLKSLNDFLLFTFIGRILGLKVVWSFDVAFYLKKNILLKYWLVFASCYAHRIIAISKFMRNNIISVGIAADKISLVYNGVESRPKLQLEFKFYKNRIKVGFIGKVSEEKGIFVFLQAAKKILQKKQNVEFWVVGNINANFKIQDYRLEKEIIFKGWQDDLSQVYQELDIVVVPSLVEESFGLVAVEAMSYGKAVVVSDRGALPELVENNKSGIVVAAGNVDILADVLGDLIDNQEKIKELGERAYERVQKMFTIERMVDETLMVYEDK